MRFTAAFLGALLISSLAHAAPVHSQARGEGESFERAVTRYRERLREHGIELPRDGGSALDVAVPLSQVDFSRVPVWKDPGEVTQGFDFGRDLRHLILSENPDFPRRASWLYPDDGCFARAAVTDRKLEENGYPRPAKLFIFGNLNVRTHNSESGLVSWWYHVVPAVSDGRDVFVLDPSIEPEKPLPVRDWIRTMVSNVRNVTLSACNPYAYAPSSSCRYSGAGEESSALPDQRYFLRQEWWRLENLGRNPNEELGDRPPWKG